MSQNCVLGTELLFVAADATWRHEAARVLKRDVDDVALSLLPEAHGQPGTLLRRAFEVRERAYTRWRSGRDPFQARATGSVVPFPATRARMPDRSRERAAVTSVPVSRG